jgi:D-sedoheptulose 7-phosphate isomerase
MKSRIVAQILDSIAVKNALLLDDQLIEQIKLLSDHCIDSIRGGGKVIFAGNGGSFADAQHLSAEFISRFMFDRKPLASIVLGANNSAISAIGNDYGYKEVFSRELRALGKIGDLFIPISTSGNSANIINAVECAQQLGLTAVALTGSSGGSLRELCTCLRVPSNETARVQECHIMIGHIICGLVEEELFGTRSKKMYGKKSDSF